jgi:hypothetical protein
MLWATAALETKPTVEQAARPRTTFRTRIECSFYKVYRRSSEPGL